MPHDTRSTLAGAFALLALLRIPPDSPDSSGYRLSAFTVVVIDSGARYPLINADVIDLVTGQHHFTDQDGRARLSWPSDGYLKLRIREVGYQPIQRTLRRAAPTDTAAIIPLSRIAYVIAPVRTTTSCAATGDSASRALSVLALEQLKQGAEKYNEFQRLYPFEARVERRTARVPQDGPIERIVQRIQRFQSATWQQPYRPGEIVEYTGSRGYNVPLLFLSTLGDSVFWERHCFIARGIEPYRGGRAIRLEFFPTSNLRGPDWAGAALLDSATSYVLLLEFRLVNLDPTRGPTRLEGYQTFSSPSPFVIIPDSVMALWWTRSESGRYPDRPDFAQSLTIDSLRYQRGVPPPYPVAKQ